LGFALGITVAWGAMAAISPIAIDRDSGGTAAEVGFQKDILPVFQANCLPCHNQTRAKAGLNLETPAALLRGGDTGPGAVPGKPAESLVLKSAAHQIEDLVMPPAGNKSNARNLTSRELGLLWRWIEQGAKADRAVVVEPAWKPISPEWKSSFAVAVDSEGATVAVARANRVGLMDLATGKPVGSLEDPSLEGATQRDVVGALAFSPDDQWLATAGFREVRLWQRRPVSVDPVVSISAKSAWVSASISPDGAWVAALTRSGTLEVRTVSTGAILGGWPWKGAAPATTNLPSIRWAWSTDGRNLAVLLGREWRCISMAEVGAPKPTLSRPVVLPADPTGMVWVPSDNLWWLAYGAAHGPQRLRRAGDSGSGEWGLMEALEITTNGRPLATDPAIGGRVWFADAEGVLERANIGANIGANIEANTGTKTGNSPSRRRFAGPVTSVVWDRSGSNGVVTLSSGLAETVFRDLSRTNGPRMGGDPRISATVLREEIELQRSRMEAELAGARIQETKTAVTQAQTALGKAQEKRDQAAKALAEREKEWSEQNALASSATRDRDAANAELARIQGEAKAATEAVQKAMIVGKKSPEAALKVIDDLVAKAEALGRRKAALERAEAEVPPRLKKAEEQLAAAQKKAGELKGALDKARIVAEGAGQDVVLAEKNVAGANASVAAAQSEEKQAQDRIRNSEGRLRDLRIDRDRSMAKPFQALALASSGSSMLTVGAEGLWTRWHPLSGRAVASFAVGQGIPLALVALDDDEFLAAFPEGVSRVRTARPWFLRQTIAGTPTAPAFTDRVNALSFSPDGTLLATGGGEPSRSGELKVWRLSDGALERDLGALHSDAVTSVAFSPRGERIASAGADRFARIIGLQTNGPRFNLEGHTHHVIGVAWAPDGSILASAGAEGTVKLWNSRTGERRKNVEGFGKEVTGLQVAGPALRFVAMSGAGKGRVFKADGEAVRDLAAVPEYLQALAVSRDGRWIVGSDDRGRVRLWDGETGQLRQSWDP
jgi:WD40 repeat protein